MLLLLDSRAPVGAHAHSAGMEAAVNAGLVTTIADVHEFCAARLRTAGSVAAGFAAAAAAAWPAFGTGRSDTRSLYQHLDEEFDARQVAPATRASSRALGGGLLRLLRSGHPGALDLLEQFAAQSPAPAPHHPIVLGVGCALAGADPFIAARAGAMGVVTAPASAALRLLGFDPYGIHAILVGLAAQIEDIADSAAQAALAMSSPANLPRDSSPAMEILAQVHMSQEVRLFAS